MGVMTKAVHQSLAGMGPDSHGEPRGQGGKDEAVEQKGRPEKRLQERTTPEKAPMARITPPESRARVIPARIRMVAVLPVPSGPGDAEI